MCDVVSGVNVNPPPLVGTDGLGNMKLFVAKFVMLYAGMEMLLASGTDCTVGVPSPDMVPDTGMGRSKPRSLETAPVAAVLDSWTNSMGVGPAAN